MPSLPHSTMPDLDTLVSLFYTDADQLGHFTAVEADELTADYRRLLAHENHMTVTVEAFHGALVDVQVLAKHATPIHYARKILLRRQTDRRVVQFGIVRLKLAYLDPAVREEIISEHIPLGRVLINHNVLRQVRLSALWQVTAGRDLCRLMNLPENTVTYGRTAMIDCNGEPAIELLEIVAPV